MGVVPEVAPDCVVVVVVSGSLETLPTGAVEGATGIVTTPCGAVVAAAPVAGKSPIGVPANFT